MARDEEGEGAFGVGDVWEGEGGQGEGYEGRDDG